MAMKSATMMMMMVLTVAVLFLSTIVTARSEPPTQSPYPSSPAQAPSAYPIPPSYSSIPHSPTPSPVENYPTPTPSPVKNYPSPTPSPVNYNNAPSPSQSPEVPPYVADAPADATSYNNAALHKGSFGLVGVLAVAALMA